MAKQSGLHQLKGKVDGYSYYRQSGVKAGLMRRINEGMSARVKSSEEFANTRLNNSEFGNAADVSKVLASVITPKFRPMFLNFSQAKLTKSLLSLIKQSTGDWGQRSLVAGDAQAVCEAVNALAKNDFATFVSVFNSTAALVSGKTNVGVEISAENISNLSAIGADGITVNFYGIAAHAGNFDTNIRSYVKSLVLRGDSSSHDQTVSSGPDSDSFELAIDTAAISNTTLFPIVCAVAMPYRIINGKNYTLQEKCTFKMIPAVVAE